jgi:formylglycine-generating enzyme required for sulfatase activity
VWTRFLIVLALTTLVPWVDAAVLSARGSQAGRNDSGYRFAGVLPKDSAEQFELTFWSSIKDSRQPGDYEAYLQAYPKGRFAGLARARIQQLRAAQAPARSPPPEQSVPAHNKSAAPEAKPARAATQENAAGNAAGKATAIAPVNSTGAPAAGATTSATPGAPAKAVPKSVPRKARVQAAPEQDEENHAPSPAGPIAAIKDCGACPVMLVLYPASFTMGNNKSDPSERPTHRVSIKAPFALGKFEVTVGQWNACVEASVCPSIPTSAEAADNLPMRDVSWDEAQLYLKWLSTVSGKEFRLPSEAEWEYAARGGTTTRFWWGESMRGGNTSCRNCGLPWNADGPPPAGSFLANPYGFFDLNGSVWEWVADCWHSSYQGAPRDGSAWAEPGCPSRVIRGGSWREDESYMLPTTRFKYDASVRQSQNGFRAARSLK